MEKELNLAILNKLYKIAADVWAKMAKSDFGTYSAKEINKYLDKRFFWADVDKDEINTITEGTYTCTFPTERLWHYIAVFEKLASVGKNAKQFVYEEVGDIIGSCTFLLDKGANELCKFAVDDYLRPVMGTILLDTKHHCLVASDGRKLLSYPVEIINSKGDMGNFLIDSKLFGKMCKGMAKKGSYIVTATKEKNGINEYCKLSFNGASSCLDRVGKYPHWDAVIPDVSDFSCITLKRGTVDALKDIKKFIGKNKKEVVYINGKEGVGLLKITIGSNEKNVPIYGKPLFDFKIAVDAKELLAVNSIEKLYLGRKANDTLVATNEYGSIYSFMTVTHEDNYENKVYYNNGLLNASESNYIGYDTSILCKDSYYNVLDIRTNNRLQALETANAVSNTTEQKKVGESAQNVAKSESSAKVVDKTAITTNKEQRKFSFDKIGVVAGDVLTFVDGTEVIATADNKVEFCGEVFTLSGFTKEFIPNPTKSGAYRGCDYFYKDGVKLGKLFKQHLATLDKSDEEVTTKEEVTECKDVALDSERKELPPPPPVIYIDIDNLPNETATGPQKCTAVPLDDESEVIAPPSEEITLESQGEPPRAKVVHFDVGTLADIVSVSLVGMTDKVTEPPPNMLGGAEVANRHYVLAAGNYSLTAGKVVHELPLPPPWSDKVVSHSLYGV